MALHNRRPLPPANYLQADWAVELGPDDETLELPWTAPEGGPQYFDLRSHPEQISQLAEVASAPELAEFLAAINSPSSIFETAKCDVWTTEDLTTEDEIFQVPVKFGGYSDLILANPATGRENARLSFSQHEQLAKRLVQLLHLVPEISASAEFLVRRCYFHAGEYPQPGFYLTCYIFGFGTHEIQARARWAIALALVQNALRQISLSWATPA